MILEVYTNKTEKQISKLHMVRKGGIRQEN